jgi:hypothetical protein
MHAVPVRGTGHIKFYVGSTGTSIEARVDKHRNPVGRVKKARLFSNNEVKSDRYDPGEIAWELMEGFPAFSTRKAAEEAEQYLAELLTSLGFPAHSDKRRDITTKSLKQS